ncbi:MAG: SoxR reducing system RseC family protein [Firmicutes bacterium]|nr:SoxR reducing system RseC family protein [Bacillota bacterium]
MRQRGVVVSRQNGLARVRLVRCAGCKGEADCPFALDLKGEKAQPIEIDAANPIGAEAGSIVQVEGDTNAILTGALIVYFLPLVLMLAGMVIARSLAAARGWGEVAPALIGGGLGLLLWFRVIKIHNMRFREDYRIVAIEQECVGEL